ncbi:hypothetical protein [Hyalangium gracile]|uniref:hypothetical protein n=1 Tax=Hyalangium gracile TaxID=394092 RepID=UPI001CCCBA62|nr:hypothetical protein [Hyalangium gracile]
MFKPEDIPPELPQEVKTLLSTLKPEPPALLERRQRLLATIEAQLPSTKGAFRQVLEAVRAMFLAMQPQVPFQARLAENFARALKLYAKELGTGSPPPLLTDCMSYLQERVESMGLGSMLETVRAASTQPGPGGRAQG